MDPCCKLLNIHLRKCKQWRRGGLVLFGGFGEYLSTRSDLSQIRLMAAWSQQPSGCSYTRSSQSRQTSSLNAALAFSPAHVGMRGGQTWPSWLHHPPPPAPSETSATVDLEGSLHVTEPVCTKRKKTREKNQPFLEMRLRILILLIIRGAAFVCRGKCRGGKGKHGKEE